MSGKDIRLSRLFRGGDRIVSIPVDHAMPHNVSPELRDIDGILERLIAGGADAVTLHKGIAKHFAPYANDASLIVKLTSYTTLDLTFDQQVASVEEAVERGADAVAAGLILGDERQTELMHQFSRISERAYALGIPLIGHIYARGQRVPAADRASVEWISTCARMGAELGADLVKTTYTGTPESFAQVVASAPIPVVAAGGTADTDLEYLQRAAEIVSSGGAGLAFGKYVWKHSRTTDLVAALVDIVRNGADPVQVAAENGFSSK